MRPAGGKALPEAKKTLGAQKPAAGRKPAGSPRPVGAKKAPVKRRTKSGRVIVVPTKAARPRWVWAAGGAALALLILLLMFLPARKDAASKPSSARALGGVAVPGLPNQATTNVPPETGIPERPLAFIKAVHLNPSQPTRQDILKAEVEAAVGAPERLAYTYQWKVNDRPVEKAQGDALDLAAFKKGDLVTVAVTPRDGDTAGFVVQSPGIAIHSIAPSLELQIRPAAVKTGEPVEAQLVSVAPDSARVTFKLEPPLVSGMTVDGASGRITWLRPADQKGTVRFGASVEDDNRTKVTKSFEITVGK
jgi:hypothetical protein